MHWFVEKRKKNRKKSLEVKNKEQKKINECVFR
jgi:hypothetical protein